MPTSVSVTTPGDGVSRDFDVPFPFLIPDHVAVYVSGVASVFGWINPSRIRLPFAPAAGAPVTVSRETPTYPLYTIPDNRPVPSHWFNTLVKQALYVAEELAEGGASELAQVQLLLAQAVAAANTAVSAAGSATKAPHSFASISAAEAADIPGYTSGLMVAGQLYVRDGNGFDLLTNDGSRWRKVPLTDTLNSPFVSTADPSTLRAALGLEAVRDAIIASGSYILDPTAFSPRSTVFGGNGTASFSLDISTAVVGWTYPVYNLGSIGCTVTLDCGEEYGIMGVGVTPNNLTSRTFVLGAGQVAYITRASLTRVFIHTEGEYWVNYGTGSKYRRLPDGTYEFLHRHGQTLAANTLSAVQEIPEGFSLDAAVVNGVSTQPKVDGSVAPASPCYVELMGTTNGLSARQFRLRNPNASSYTHQSITHLTNVTRP